MLIQELISPGITVNNNTREKIKAIQEGKLTGSQKIDAFEKAIGKLEIEPIDQAALFIAKAIEEIPEEKTHLELLEKLKANGNHIKEKRKAQEDTRAEEGAEVTIGRKASTTSLLAASSRLLFVDQELSCEVERKAFNPDRESLKKVLETLLEL